MDKDEADEIKSGSSENDDSAFFDAVQEIEEQDEPSLTGSISQDGQMHQLS